MDNNKPNKPWKDLLASYLNEPTLPNLRRLIQYEAIEDDDLEFKEKLLHEAEIAQHILARGNTRGGVIIFGLKEVKTESRFEPVGIESNIEPTSLQDKLDKYLPYELLRELIEIVPAFYEESDYGKLKGKLFLVIIVRSEPRYIPFLPKKESGNVLKKSIIYVRKNRSSRPAEYDDIQNILKKRIETEYTITPSKRKLREHLEELKELYSHIPKTIGGGAFSKFAAREMSKIINTFNMGDLEYVPSKDNPNYPEEGFEAFVNRMIEKKKLVIEQLITE
jgi:hypothetical protein